MALADLEPKITMTSSREHIIPASVAGTLDGLFRERVRRTPDAPAYRSYNRDQQEWEDVSWSEMAAIVGRWQEALRAERLQIGDRVALQLRNGVEWVAFEQAALGLGLVVVPLYVEDRPDNLAYIVNDAGVKVLLLTDKSHWKRLAALKDQLKSLQRILLLSGKPGEAVAGDDRVIAVIDWLVPGPSALAERGGDPDRLATIVYTSGTTGRPKGVMLSHRNVLANVDGVLRVVDGFPDDVFLSFLPLSHTFERTCGYYAPMAIGCTIAYARSVQQLAEDMRNIKPTIIISVPRVFERIHDRLEEQLEKQSLAARLAYRLAVNVGWRRFQCSQGRGRAHPLQLLSPVLQRAVGAKFSARLGGRLRLAVSGGAALPLPVARTFIGLGLNLIQGYGMTETSPIVAANTLEHNHPDSVGRPLPGVQVRCGVNDELLVKGPNVMLGYWNNHKATSETIDPDGWLHTGDQARIDEAGFIHITGRIKDILVMSNGEKIPPADMESAITLDPAIDQAVVVGEARAFLGALLVLNAEHWFSLAREHRLDPFDHCSLQDRELHQTLLGRIAHQLHDFPGYAKIRRVVPLLEPWNIENGLLTPTLKTRRAMVLKRYGELIEAMYQ